MANAYTKLGHSVSSKGEPTVVVATGSPGTLVHTAVDDPEEVTVDEIFIWATNNSGTDVQLTLEFGGLGATYYLVEVIPSTEGPILIVPGWPVWAGMNIRAFCAVSESVSLSGFVNRIRHGTS